MARKKVVVCGAGFAGIKVAKGLEGKADVTLVAPTDRFVYLPLIHEMLSERQLPRDVTRPLRDIVPAATLLHDAAAGVDGDELVTRSGHRVPFDALVVAVGAEPNDFGVPGVHENTYSFYSVKDALLANAALKTAVVEHHGRPVRVVVVGASFTGVEVAAEAAELLRSLDAPYDILLLDALPTIFPNQSDEFRRGIQEGLDRLRLAVRTGQTITRVEPGRVHVGHGEGAGDGGEGGEGSEVVDADVVFWCAGARPRRLDGIEPRVRPTLQSIERDDVFLLGDAADFPRDMAVPKLAQTAEAQAPTVVHNLLHPDRPVEYKPEVKGLIVSVGHRYAVAEVGGTVLKGTIPWHVKRRLYKTKIALY